MTPGSIEFKRLNAVGFWNGRSSFVYDTFSNEILQVDPVVLDVLDDSFELTRERVIEKHSARYPATVVRQALLDIETIQRGRQALVPFRIPALSLGSKAPLEEIVQQRLENELTQLTINVTENCNLRCRYCVYSGAYSGRRSHNRANEISLPLAMRAVDYFAERSKKSARRFLSLYGGEPLLRFDFVKALVEYARQVMPDVSVAMTTNGTLLDETKMKFLEANDVALTISLDGPEKAHDSNRVYVDGRGTFDSVRASVEMIQRKFPEFYAHKLKINSVVAPHECSPEMVEDFFASPLMACTWRNQGFSLGLINPQDNTFMKTHNYTEYVRNYYVRTCKQFMKAHAGGCGAAVTPLTRALLDRQIRMIYFRSKLRLREYDFFWPNGICIPGMRSLFVSASGRFYPCEKLYDYGDMEIGDIESGFDVKKIVGFVREYCEQAVEDCRHCWALRLCGDCFLTFRGGGSWDLAKRRDFCAGQRSMWVSALALYATILEKNSSAFEYLAKEENRGYGSVNEVMR